MPKWMPFGEPWERELPGEHRLAYHAGMHACLANCFILVDDMCAKVSTGSTPCCRLLREGGSEAAATRFERFMTEYDPRNPAPVPENMQAMIRGIEVCAPPTP